MGDRQLELNSNSRMEAVQSPLIPVVGEWIRQNPGTISLGQGVVSYPPPPEAVAAVTDFLAHPGEGSSLIIFLREKPL